MQMWALAATTAVIIWVEMLVQLQKIGAQEVRQDFSGKVTAMCQQQHVDVLLADPHWPEFDWRYD